MDILKNKFTRDILFQNAYQAGVSTRNKVWPVFVSDKPDHSKFKSRFQELLEEFSKDYRLTIDSEKHINQISRINSALSDEFRPILLNGKMRFGITQKIVNLYLKFLWCIGEIQVPPHCPIDFVVKRSLLMEDKTLVLPNWTEMNRGGYIVYLKAFERLGVSNIAEWELTCWNQNNKYL